MGAGGDWKLFNECHVPSRHSLVRLYGSHRQLYSYTELVKTALKHAALPIFLIQAGILHCPAMLSNHPTT